MKEYYYYASEESVVENEKTVKKILASKGDFELHLLDAVDQPLYTREIKSKAATLFLQDLADENSSLRARFIPAASDVDGTASEDDVLLWCAKTVLAKLMTERGSDFYGNDGYYCAAYPSDQCIICKFFLPKSAAEEVFSPMDIAYLDGSAPAMPTNFRLCEMGEKNVVRYALAAYYWELALVSSRYPEALTDPMVRKLERFYFGPN